MDTMKLYREAFQLLGAPYLEEPKVLLEWCERNGNRILLMPTL